MVMPECGGISRADTTQSVTEKPALVRRHPADDPGGSADGDRTPGTSFVTRDAVADHGVVADDDGGRGAVAQAPPLFNEVRSDGVRLCQTPPDAAGWRVPTLGSQSRHDETLRLRCGHR